MRHARSVVQPVVVVGAGVVGLSCAVRLVEAGYAVEVVTSDDPSATTSSVAGGLWLPYRAEPAERVSAWARATLLELVRLHETDRSAAVLRREGVLLHRTPVGRPSWAGAIADLVPLREVTDPAPGYASGLSLTVPVVDVPRYLDSLVRRFLGSGGRLVHRSLAELPRNEIVVHCAGLGARALVGDEQVRPVRGQVVVLSQPGLDRWLVDEQEVDGELAYVLPRHDDVVVGGSATEDDEDLTPDPRLARRMLDRAYDLVPQLRGATVLAHRVGLRPVRPQVRLEVEHSSTGAVVHCYGHGGAGVTLSWGCADEVLGLVRGLGPATGQRHAPVGR